MHSATIPEKLFHHARHHKLYPWQLVEEVYEFAPDVVERIIGKIKLPFVLTLAGTDSLLQKYLAEYSASSFLDENGNTLLHAALLRAVYANMESLFKPDDLHRQSYDFLLKKRMSL